MAALFEFAKEIYKYEVFIFD